MKIRAHFLRKEAITMNDSGYTSSEILAMQRDAIRRVQEMQRRANIHVPPVSPAPTADASQEQRREDPPPKKYHQEQKNSPAVLLPNRVQGLINSIGLGEDKAVVLAVILILLSQNADQTLIIALLYLIM